MPTNTRTAEDMRRALFDDDEADRAVTKAAYDQTVADSAAKREPVRTLQKIARLWAKWDSEPRDKTRSRKALAQLSQVPPTPENCTWMFEQALRSALRAAMNEEAEAETDRWNKRASGGESPQGYLKKKAYDDEVRSVFRNAIRVDAGSEDVNRVMRAIKALKDSGDGEDL